MEHDPAQIFPCRIEGADPFRPAAILTELPVKTVQQLRRHEHRSPHLRRDSTRERRKIRLLLPADQDHGKVPRQTAEKEIAGSAVDDLFPVAEQIAERDFSVFRAGPDEQSFRQYLNIRHHVCLPLCKKKPPRSVPERLRINWFVLRADQSSQASALRRSSGRAETALMVNLPAPGISTESPIFLSSSASPILVL